MTANVLLSSALMFVQYKFIIGALGTSRVGVWSLVLAITSLSRLGDMGFSSGVSTFVGKYDGAGDPVAVAQVVHTSLIWVAVSMGVVSMLLVPLASLYLKSLLPPTEEELAALLIVPCVIALWVSALATVYLGALDGYKRSDRRAAIQLLGGVVYCAGTVVLVSLIGFAGLGVAQLLQATVLFVTAGVLFHRASTCNLLMPRWHSPRFREMWRFSRDSQLIAIANLSFDPITKALLARFGSLPDTALFEIASRCMVQVRMLISAGCQVIVPIIAGLGDHAHEEVASIYRRSCVLYVAFGFPLFAGLAAALPAISEVLLGHYDPTFVFFGILLAAGGFVNVLSMPAWHVNVGKRQMRRNVITQMIVLVGNGGLGYVLGRVWGGVGVVGGWGAALTIGAVFLIVTYQKQTGSSFAEWFPERSAWVPTASVLATVLCWMTYRNWGLQIGPVRLSIGMLALFASLVVPALLTHPYRKPLIVAWRSSTKSQPATSWHLREPASDDS